jgi:HPt (histidine-containing phosphotransfer) domain-containing protein
MNKGANTPADYKDRPMSKLAESPQPTIDLVHLSRQTLGDYGLEQELLGLFARQARTIAERLAAPARGGDASWRADLAHTLKGSAVAIGAAGVARAAADYEDAARAGAPLDAHWRALEAALTTAGAAVEDLLERTGS